MTIRNIRGKHTFGEAFMLMAYQCEKCGKEELIWNSRDGVTPFYVGCRFCGGDAKHVRWQQDVYSPGYQPAPGERIFVDLTPETARAIAERQVARCDGTQYEVQGEERETLIDSAAADMLERGEPDMVEVKEDEKP